MNDFTKKERYSFAGSLRYLRNSTDLWNKEFIMDQQLKNVFRCNFLPDEQAFFFNTDNNNNNNVVNYCRFFCNI